MKKLGRPRRFDERKRSRAAFFRSIGVPMEAIARYLECDPSTLRREMQRDPAFRERMDEAADGLETILLGNLVNAAATEPKAAKYLRKQILSVVDAKKRRPRVRRHANPPTSGSPCVQKSQAVSLLDLAKNPRNADEFANSRFDIRSYLKNNFELTAQKSADADPQNSHS
jgi:hypothetical protein